MKPIRIIILVSLIILAIYLISKWKQRQDAKARLEAERQALAQGSTNGVGLIKFIGSLFGNNSDSGEITAEMQAVLDAQDEADENLAYAQDEASGTLWN